MPNPAALVVFSHLRWNLVYQRPQHLLSRIRKHRRVYFVEEPVFDERGPARLEIDTVAENVTVLRPRTPIPTAGYSAAQLPEIRALLKEYLIAEPIGEHRPGFTPPWRCRWRKA